MLRLGANTADVMDQVPDLFVGASLAEARHPAQTDSILDDPEELGVGPLLHFGRTEIERARVHPAADFARRAALVPVTRGALASKSYAPDRHARLVVWRSYGQRPAGTSRDEPVLGLGGEIRFRAAGLVERAEAELRSGDEQAN